MNKTQLRMLADFAAVVRPIQHIPTGLRGDRRSNDDAIAGYFAQKRRDEKKAAVGLFYREYYGCQAGEDFEVDYEPADILNPIVQPKRIRVSDDWDHEAMVMNYRVQHLGLTDEAVPSKGDRRVMGGHR